MRNNRIHSLHDFDAQGLNELWLWLEGRMQPMIRRKTKIGNCACVPNPCGEGASGGSGEFQGMTYRQAITTLQSTLAWGANWTLGEGALPFVDSINNSPYTNMINAFGVFDTPPTYNQTPGLMPAAIDDGAVAFNAQGGAGSTDTGYITTSFAGSSVFDTSPSSSWTLIAWIFPFAPTQTWEGAIFNAGSTNFGPWYGWTLNLSYVNGATSLDLIYRHNAFVAGTVFTLTSTVKVTTTETHMVAVTYNGPTRETILYLDGVAVGSGFDTGNFDSFSSYFTVQMGGYPLFGGVHPFYGILDEVSWIRAKASATQITDLYNTVALPGPGWVLQTDGSCGLQFVPITSSIIKSGTALADQALVADGSGGTTWAYPKHGVYVNGS